ncbi:hypothetical protein SLA2020_448630 [Shorea laevis]
MAEEVLLFGVRGSPFSHRIEMALKLKGVEYKYVEEDLANKSPLLLKYNHIHRRFLFLYTMKILSSSPKLFSNTLMRHGQDIPYCPKIPMKEPLPVSGPSS